MSSYVAQFLPLPPNLLKWEKGLLARVLKLPPTAFGANDLFSLHLWTGLVVPSMRCYSIAIMVRAALFSTSTWMTEARDLQNSVLKFNHPEASLKSLPRVHFSAYAPPFLDSLPICIYMLEASQGFPNSPQKSFKAAGSEILKIVENPESLSPVFPKASKP